MDSSVIFQIQSAIILLLMYVGVYNRKNRNLHVKMMLGAIIWDVLLILQIELTRSAIAKASKVFTNPLLLKVHLFFAITSVVLYVVMGLTGKKLLNGDNSVRSRHKVLGWTTLFFRTMTFITSFWAVSNAA
jgi:cyanate permease